MLVISNLLHYLNIYKYLDTITVVTLSAISLQQKTQTKKTLLPERAILM